MNSSFTTLAIVIHRQSQSEKNIKVSLLTPNYGKIFAIATGAKSIKSRRLGSLEPGSLVQLQISFKNNLYWISEVKSITSFLLTPKNLIQINLLFYILEIINSTIPEKEPSTTVFDLTQKLINALINNHLPSFLNYQIQLLHQLGFGLPPSIQQNFTNKKYHLLQRQLLSQFENIREKPFFSRKLLLN